MTGSHHFETHDTSVSTHLSTAEELAEQNAQLSERVESLQLEHADLAQQLYLAEHDLLSGLPGRAMFSRALEASVTESPARTALLMFDIDGLKKANDELPGGHLAGDKIIRETAMTLRNALPSTVFVSRLQGDEFAVILSRATNEAYAKKIGTWLQGLLREHGIPVSVGAALHAFQADGTPETSSELLHRADRAMYTDKLQSVPNLTPQQLGAFMLAMEHLRDATVDPRNIPKYLAKYSLLPPEAQS